MARQFGPLRLKGTLSGLIFYKNKHGYLAREKGGVSKEQMATEKRFERSRETATEFGYSSRVGKLLRQGVHAACDAVHDGDTNTRLSAAVMEAVLKDAVSARGARRLNATNVTELHRFEWRLDAQVSLILRVPYVLDVNIAAGTASCRIADFLAGRDMVMPEGATHVVLSLGVVRVDFGGNSQVSAVDRSVFFDLADGSAGVNLNLQCVIPDGGDVVMVGIGLQGYQEVGGQMMRLREGAGFVVGRVVAV